MKLTSCLREKGANNHNNDGSDDDINNITAEGERFICQDKQKETVLEGTR